MINVIMGWRLPYFLFHLVLVQASESDSMTILMPNVVPKTANSYLCTSLPIDPEKQRYIVAFSPNASMNVVHHMILQGCTVPGSREAVWNCGDMMNKEHHHEYPLGEPCDGEINFLYAWARDAPPVQLPEGVAFEIGKNTPIKSLVLLVHYKDVTGFQNGNKDNSGVVLHFIEERQLKTAGVLILGTSGHIPANSTELMDVAWVVDENKDFHPFAFRTHTHSLGHVVSGYHVRRDDKGEDHWTLLGKKSPMLPQTFYPVVNNVTVTKGDILAARCTMINSKAHATSIGSTNEHEMCNFYIMYWMEGSEPLKTKMFFSHGPPEYYWNKGWPPLNNIPELEASSI